MVLREAAGVALEVGRIKADIGRNTGVLAAGCAHQAALRSDIPAERNEFSPLS